MRRANVSPALRLPLSRRAGGLSKFFLILIAFSTGCAKGTGGQPVRPMPPENLSYYLAPLLLVSAVLLAVLIWWFLKVFTGPLEADPRLGGRNEPEITRMVKFCYVFTVLSLFATAAPLVIVLMMPQTGVADKFYLAMMQSPIGLVLGCVHAPKDEAWELACTNDKYRYQWILNVGGSAFLVPEFEHTSAPIYKVAPSATDAGSATALANASAPSATPGPSAQSPANQPYQEKNLDLYARWLPVAIHGGLAVPWFVLFISVLGGAVSMARRVPEYQRRALDISDDSLSPAKAREEMVFQIIQVMTAPLIAITAYNVLTPDSRAATVGLAFASGFSSEAILMAIRGFTDRLIGIETKPTTGQPKVPFDWLDTLTIELGKAAVSALKGEGPAQPPTG